MVTYLGFKKNICLQDLATTFFSQHFLKGILYYKKGKKKGKR